MPTKKKAAQTKKKAPAKKSVISKLKSTLKKVVSPKKKSTIKKTTTKKAAVKKTTKKAAKKTTTKKAATKKTTTKKATTKKATAKNATTKKAVTKKAATKKTTTKKKGLEKKVATTTKTKTETKAAPKKIVVKKVTPKTSAPKKTNKRNVTFSDTTFMGIPAYNEGKNEEYMNDKQRDHIRSILFAWRQLLMEEVDRTVSHMKDEAANFPDPSDRASQEEEFSLELRTRDRERKLIKKIEDSLENLSDEDFGYCETCGIEIGIRRLEARPTATLCIDCKTLAEIKERQNTGG